LNLTFTFSDENFKEFLFKWFDKVIFSNTKALSIESVNKFELDSQEVKKIHDLVPNLGNWYFFNNITIDFTDINKKNSITQVNLIPNHESIPKGLENLKNLKTLILKLNKKSSIKKLDVSFVKQLKQLEDITLNESSISDYLELEIKKISPKIKVYKETIKYKL
jgi:Leucine-rich repeat (LRR) protein